LFAATTKELSEEEEKRRADKLKFEEKDVQQWISFARGLIDFSPDLAGLGRWCWTRTLIYWLDNNIARSSGSGVEQSRSFQMAARGVRRVINYLTFMHEKGRKSDNQ
jgi:hypothetical protein